MAEEAPKPGKRRVWLAIVLVVIVLGAVGGLAYWLYARQFESTDDAFIDGRIVQVSPRVSGIVQSVEVRDNQDVAEGTVLVRLDPTDYEARLRQARAELASAQARHEAAARRAELTRAQTQAALVQAKAGLERAKAAVQSSKSQEASARADVTAAEAEAQRRSADLKRYESLDPRAVSRQQLDAARAASESADAVLAAARKKASAAEAAIEEARAGQGQAEGVLAAAETAPQQVAVAEADAQSAQAAAKQAAAVAHLAELDLSYTVIRAPVAGRVTRKSLRPGQYFQTGQTMMALVESDVWVAANFKETQIAHMAAGQIVDIKVDAYPGHTFHGVVDSVQAGSGARFSLLPPENATGNYVKVVQRVPVKIVFDRDEARHWLLGPGMSVVPRVHVGTGGEQRPQPIAPPPATMPSTAASSS